MQLRPLGPSGPVVHCIQSGAEMAKMFRNNPNKLLRFNPLDSQHRCSECLADASPQNSEGESLRWWWDLLLLSRA